MSETDPVIDSASADDLFPSGPWRGFYVYSSSPPRHRMDLRLEFKNGRIDGSGADDIGYFTIAGNYNTESLEARWRKTYPGRHDVHYRGFREGKGIWGTWSISIFMSGGFRIWPKGCGEFETVRASVEQEAPVEILVRPPVPVIVQ